jgi:hypothetical protein
MKLCLLNEFAQSETELTFVIDGKLRILKFGDDVPLPREGWSIVHIISLADWWVFHLKNGDATGYWFFNSDFNFVASSVAEFVTVFFGSPTATSAFGRMHSLEYDIDVSVAIDVLYDLMMEMASEMANRCLPEVHLPSEGTDHHIWRLFSQLNTPKSPVDVFDQIIVPECVLDGYIFAVDDTLGGLKFDRFLPIDNFWYIGFSSDGSHNYIAFITDHAKHVVALFEPLSFAVWAQTDLTEIGFTPIFYTYARLVIFWFGSALGQARPPAFRKMGVMFRENHIGHYIWNELSAVHLLRKWNKDVYAFLYDTCNEPAFAIGEVFPDMSERVCRGASNLTMLKASIIQGIEFFPFMSFRIEAEFSARLADLAVSAEKKFNEELLHARSSSFILLIGLRLENRSWVEQKQGYIALIDQLASLKYKFTILFDGHNYRDRNSKNFIRSHRESLSDSDAPSEIVAKEIEIAEEIMRYVRSKGYGNVKLINLIPCTVARSIVAALNCDYLITHWGAGLAKYKWAANANGCIISSRKVLESKADLHIYDSPHFLENATQLYYYPSELIQDIGSDTHLIAMSDKDRDNFNLNKDLFAQTMRTIITDIIGRKTVSKRSVL